MGAKNCPETPRQQMIGMMYLVLTAMLALNVSKDILQAFDVVDSTLTLSNISVKEAIDFKYAALAKDTTAKAKQANIQATKLKNYSSEMVDYIEALRIELIKYVDGEKSASEAMNKPENAGRIPVADIEAKDNFDKPTTFFLMEDSSGKLLQGENDPNSRANVLKDKIKKFKTEILSLLPDSTENDKERKQYVIENIGLDVDAQFVKGNGDKTTESWEHHNFNHLICAGTAVLLSKMVGEVRNAETMVLDEITKGIDANDFKFDKVSGRAIPKSQIVFAGSNYESDVIVAAFNSSTDLEVYYKMGADTLTEDEIGSAEHIVGVGGIAKLQFPAGSTGDHKFAGLIKVKGPNGYDYYGFKDAYSVLQPSATVAADKMNVLYANIPNPVSVGGSVDVNKLSVSFSGGCTLKSTGPGHYDVSVPASLIGKTVTATVTAKADGGSKAMGSSEFRVKKVPDPTSYLGANIWGGKRSKNELMANPFISARMGDDFAYDLNGQLNLIV